LVSALENLGTLALHQQDVDRAMSMLEESITLLRRVQFTWSNVDLAWALIHLAEARRVAADRPDRGGRATSQDASIRELWEEGLALLRAAEARRAVAWGLVEVGELVFEQGDDTRAGSLLREGVEALRELDGLEDLGRALDAIAAVWAVVGPPVALRGAVQLWSAATI
jgi:hypothetical protein